MCYSKDQQGLFFFYIKYIKEGELNATEIAITAKPIVSVNVHEQEFFADNFYGIMHLDAINNHIALFLLQFPKASLIINNKSNISFSKEYIIKKVFGD